MKVEREVVVTNKEGLHFRPIMQLVDTAQRFSAKITVECEGRAADGRSPMELLMLVGVQGSKIKLMLEGPDAQEAADEIAKLFENGFGES